MKRRNFLRSSLGAGLAAGAFMSFGRYEKAFAGKPLPAGANYDLIAVMGGEPAAMFDMGIQAMGGMGTFVRKGQKVLVKPNIGWDVVPEKGGNTNPALGAPWALPAHVNVALLVNVDALHARHAR